MKAAYIVSLFPCWSETFILREIIELERAGLPVEIFSLKPASEKLVHPEAEPYLQRVHYPAAWTSLFQTILMLVRHPYKLLSLIFLILKDLPVSPAMTLKTLGMIPRVMGFLPALKSAGVTHIHAHWATYPAAAAWMINRLSGIPFSFTAHAHDIFLEKPLLKEKIDAAKFVATISDYNRRYLRDFTNGGSEKIRIVRCGIQLQDFPVRNQPGHPIPEILAVGRYDEIKGFPDLVDACRLFRDEGIRFHCTIVGDGPLRQQLENQIAEANLGNSVELLTALPQDVLRKKMAQATLFVMPSVRTSAGNQDGIPVVLMEAMAMGLPVVATGVSGIPELVIDQETGLLAESGNPENLAETIKMLLVNPRKQQAYAQAGRKLIESEFNIEKSAAVLAQSFHESAGQGV